MAHGRPEQWIWAYACDLITQLQYVQGQSLQQLPRQGGGQAWQAPVDVYETDAEIILIVALPGVPSDAIDVRIEGGDLVIRAHRRLTIPEGAMLRRLEIPHGRFERRLPLPAGRFDLGPWTLADGCLRLSFRRTD
jgi:HSP20 family molecular chaperone IbpA